LGQKTDLAIADLFISYEREQAVDFTLPFMNTGISILYNKPQKQPPSLFSFLAPMSMEVWVTMCSVRRCLAHYVRLTSSFNRLFDFVLQN
jgi:glutamate receptor, ionotropic, invertebrate